MPFTPVHPTAILPFLGLRREGGWKAALVSGSLVPDLVSLSYEGSRVVSHSVPGAILLDLPMALLMTFLWHRYAEPRFQRLPGVPQAPPKPLGWWAVLCGAAIGILTHLVWDLFTHDQSPFLRMSGLYTMPLFDTPAGPFTVGQLSWYVNTFAGALILASWVTWKAVKTIRRGSRPFRAGPWLRLALIPPLPLLLIFGTIRPDHWHSTKQAFLDVIFSEATIHKLMGACALLAVAVFLWETRRKSNLPRSA